MILLPCISVVMDGWSFAMLTGLVAFSLFLKLRIVLHWWLQKQMQLLFICQPMLLQPLLVVNGTVAPPPNFAEKWYVLLYRNHIQDDAQKPCWTRQFAQYPLYLSEPLDPLSQRISYVFARLTQYG